MIHYNERIENRRLLVVDDDPLILSLYQRLFTELKGGEKSPGAEGPSPDTEGASYEQHLDRLAELVNVNVQSADQRVLQQATEQRGRKPYELTSCSQGEDAVAAVKQSLELGRPYAVALIDMRMPPGIDGLETAQQIRQFDTELQLVFVTAYSDHSTDKIYAAVGGQVLFFHKPLQKEELYQTVRNCCWSWNQGDELRQLRENLEYRVELQTHRLRERIRTTDLLHQNAVTREQRIIELNHKNSFLQAYQELRLLLTKEPLPQPRSVEEVRRQLAQIGYPLTLLLVDDSEAIRRSYQSELEQIGFQVRVAETAEQGMALALEEPPDLALIDHHLPGLAGDQLIHRMRANPTTTLVLPILFTNIGDELSAVLAGAVHWLQKDRGLQQVLQQMGLIRDYLIDQRLPQSGGSTGGEVAVEELEENRRVLLVDDEQANIDFLINTLGGDVDELEFEQDIEQLMDVMGVDHGGSRQPESSRFEITATTQGLDAVSAVLQAQQAGAPYALAIIDMRMPPGIDGLETARQIRQISNEIEIVITTAYSDYTLEQLREELGNNFSFIGKPFNDDEVYQRVVEGCSKWSAANRARSTHQALLGLAEEMQQEIARRRETERKLEQANKTKDDFLSSMSHELRTPLTTIIGYNEVLREEPQLPRQYREMLDSSILAGKTLLQLVNDILDMSKIRSGKFELSEQPFDLRKILRDLADLIGVYGSEKGVTVSLKIDADVEPLLQRQWVGDDIRISQILFNLLSNAVKFSDGSGEVTLRLGWVEHPPLEVPGLVLFSLQVEDQGVGMSAETLSRLFTPFEQADSSTSRRFGGTGLGLFIAQQLTQMMGGSIRVESEEGRGSRFTVELPLQQSELAAASPEALQAEAEEAANQDKLPRLQGRVLLAEDTVQLQRLAVLLIEKCGLQVDLANNGLEALEMGLQHPYGLILMDMQMPEMDGIEATRRLYQQGCKTPVVALTANVMQKHRDAFKEAGCSGFLSKPIKRSKLYALLKSHFPAAAAVGVDEALPEEEALPGEEVLEDEEDLSSLIDDEMWQEFWDYLSDAELNLQQAWEQREWDRLRSVAHAIKGMGSSYGQPEMTEIAAGLQDAAPGGDPGVIEPLYRQLVDLLQQQNPNHAE